MANFGNIQQGIASGIQTGRSIGGGGFLGGLGSVISKVADRLKKDRLAGEELESEKEIIRFKKSLKSPLEELIEQSQGVEAAGILGRTDLARAIREASGGATQAQETPAIVPKNLLGTTSGVIEPRRIETSSVEPLRGQSKDLLFKKFKETTNVFGETTREPTEIISRQALIDEKIAGEATKAVGKQLESLVKTSGNFSRVENSFAGLVGQMKRAVIEQGGFGFKAAVTGRGKRLIQRLGLQEGETTLEEQMGGLAGFEAQRQEVILSLAPILTNQNRILRSALTMIKKTVPDLPLTGTTESEVAENIRQSMKNSFKLALGIARGLLPPEAIIDLTENATDEEITEFLTDLVRRTRFTEEDENFFNSIFKRVIKTPATKPVGLFQPGEKGSSQFKNIRKSTSTTNKKFFHLSDEELDAKINALKGK